MKTSDSPTYTVAHRKILSQMVEQYRNRHNRLPSKIVVSPLAMAALAIKRSIAANWAGIRVECREVNTKSLTLKDDATCLGIAVDTNSARAQLVGFDLR